MEEQEIYDRDDLQEWEEDKIAQDLFSESVDDFYHYYEYEGDE